MAATLEGEALSKSWSTFNDAYRYVIGGQVYNFMSNNYGKDLDFVLSGIWLLHERNETKLQIASSNFYKAYRQVETGKFDAPEFAKTKNPYSEVIKGFMIHGPKAIEKKEKLLGIPFSDFSPTQKKQSFNNVANEMTLQAMAAPRKNMLTTIDDDPDTTKWVRKADSGACNFCIFLAARGPVFVGRTAKFSAHGNCGCSAEPVYSGWKTSPEQDSIFETWLTDNQNRETRARRFKNVEQEIEAGLKEKKITTSTDKFGRTSERITYVETQKAKDLKKNSSKQTRETISKNSRDENFKKPAMTAAEKKKASEDAAKVIEDILKIRN